MVIIGLLPTSRIAMIRFRFPVTSGVCWQTVRAIPGSAAAADYIELIHKDLLFSYFPMRHLQATRLSRSLFAKLKVEITWPVPAGISYCVTRKKAVFNCLL